MAAPDGDGRYEMTLPVGNGCATCGDLALGFVATMVADIAFLVFAAGRWETVQFRSFFVVAAVVGLVVSSSRRRVMPLVGAALGVVAFCFGLIVVGALVVGST